MDVNALQRELAAAVSGDVRFDAVSRALYSTDASVYQIEPVGVLIPKSRADVIAAVTICAKRFAWFLSGFAAAFKQRAS